MQYSGGGVENMFSTIALQVLCPELGSSGLVVLPRSSLVSDLKREACAELGVAEAEVMLFDYFGGQCYAALEDRLNVTISTARLMDRQAVLLKGRDGKAPSPVSLACLTGFSRPPDMMLQFDDNSQLAVHRCILELSSPLLQDILAQSPPGSATATRFDCHPPSSPPTPTYTQTNKAHSSSWQSPPVTPSHSFQQASHTTQPCTTGHHTTWAQMGAYGMAGHLNSHTSTGASGSAPTGATHRLACATSVAANRPGLLGHQTQGSDIQGMVAAGATSTGAAGEQPSTSGDVRQVAMEEEQDMFVLRVPGDERYSWVYCLQLLYPCCQMRRPPITWSNILRILALADKWMITSVLRVCEDFLLLPNSQLSTFPSDPAYVWRWMITADRLHMPLVVRKCIAFIQIARVTSGYERQQLDKAVAEVVTLCSPAVVTQLITSLCAFKDELQAVAK